MKSFARFALATAVVASLSATTALAQTTVSFYDVNPTFASTIPGAVIVNTPVSASIGGAPGTTNLSYVTTATAATPNRVTVDPPPDFRNANLGIFTLFIAPGQAMFTVPPGSTTFSVTVVQTLPSNGNQLLTSTLSGFVVNAGGALNSTLGLAFATPNFTIGNVTYALNNLTNSGGFSNVFLIAPGLNVLSVRVTATPIPEPSTLAMAGMGGLSLLGYSLRRYRKVSA